MIVVVCLTRAGSDRDFMNRLSVFLQVGDTGGVTFLEG